MNKTFLFAYGTLRKGFQSEVAGKVDQYRLYLGTGKVKATMYDLGDYPGAIKTDDNTIEGDVFELLDEEVLQVLDEYEGDEYIREMVSIEMNPGENLTAWIYWYNGTFDAGKLIKGDYRNYLKTKDSLQ